MEIIFKILQSLFWLIYSVAFTYLGIQHRHTLTVKERMGEFILAGLFLIMGVLVWWN